MTPAQAIAMLDRQLASHGEDVVHHVMTGGVAATGTTVRAFVRGYKPDELVNGITQKDRKVTLSPTGGLVPAESNRLMIGGHPCRIQAVEPVRLAGTVVRYHLQVRG